jgi:hypothetical protein
MESTSSHIGRRLIGLLVKWADDSAMQRRFGILTEGSLDDYGKMATQYIAFMFRVCGCLKDWDGVKLKNHAMVPMVQQLYRELRCDSKVQVLFNGMFEVLFAQGVFDGLVENEPMSFIDFHSDDEDEVQKVPITALSI